MVVLCMLSLVLPVQAGWSDDEDEDDFDEVGSASGSRRPSDVASRRPSDVASRRPSDLASMPGSPFECGQEGSEYDFQVVEALEESRRPWFDRVMAPLLQMATPHEFRALRQKTYDILLQDFLRQEPTYFIATSDEVGTDGGRIVKLRLPSLQALSHVDSFPSNPQVVVVQSLQMGRETIEDVDALLEFLKRAPPSLCAVELGYPISYGAALDLMIRPQGYLLSGLEKFLGEEAAQELQRLHVSLWPVEGREQQKSLSSDDVEAMLEHVSEKIAPFMEAYLWRDQFFSYADDSRLHQKIIGWVSKHALLGGQECLERWLEMDPRYMSLSADAPRGVDFVDETMIMRAAFLSSKVRELFYAVLPSIIETKEERQMKQRLQDVFESQGLYEPSQFPTLMEDTGRFFAKFRRVARWTAGGPQHHKRQLSLESPLDAVVDVRRILLEDVGLLSADARPDWMAEHHAVRVTRLLELCLSDVEGEWVRLDVEDEDGIEAVRQALEATAQRDRKRWLSLKIAGDPDILFADDGGPKSLADLLSHVSDLERVFVNYTDPSGPYGVTYKHLFNLFSRASVPIILAEHMLAGRADPTNWLQQLVAINQQRALPVEEENETWEAAFLEMRTLFESEFLWRDVAAQKLTRLEGVHQFLEWIEKNGARREFEAFYPEWVAELYAVDGEGAYVGAISPVQHLLSPSGASVSSGRSGGR